MTALWVVSCEDQTPGLRSLEEAGPGPEKPGVGLSPQAGIPVAFIGQLPEANGLGSGEWVGEQGAAAAESVHH